MAKKTKKNILTAIFFLVVMVLTIYTVFNGEDLGDIAEALSQLSPVCLSFAVIAALLYISCEGFMIWFMIAEGSGLRNLLQCIGYSFIGFFYSGITPSASGGQPMQLVHMKKDGYRFSKSCAALTAIAAMNKFVLASVGVGLLVFWYRPLCYEFEGYMGWFYLGLLILFFWVFVLGFLMFAPHLVERAAGGALSFFEKRHILKSSEKRHVQLVQFFNGYRDIVGILKSDSRKTVLIFLLSYLQRFFLVSLVYLIYIGFGLSGSSFHYVFLVQIAIMISVDMLPVPGAQGISEFLYRRVFGRIFSDTYLTASMCLSRFVNFYLLLLIGAGVVIVKHLMAFGRKTPDKSKNDAD